jgi:hypothetical protein
MDDSGDRNQTGSDAAETDAVPVTIVTMMLLSDSARKMVTMVTLMLRPVWTK